MRGVYNKPAAILNARVDSADASVGTITIAANEQEYWVLRKLWASHDADSTGDFDALNTNVEITVKIGGTLVWAQNVHPGNGGTGSLEFENGPWVFDLSPGLYVGTKNQALLIEVASFGIGIASSSAILYQ